MLRDKLWGLMLTIVTIDCAVGLPSDDYWKNRAALLKSEDELAMGGRGSLLPREQVVNDLVMAAKRRELDRGFANPADFLPAKNFLDAKKEIERSPIYNIIRKMPKGAVLHSHDTAIVSEDFVFNLTYRKNLYACEIGPKPNQQLALRFFDRPNQDCNWKLLSEMRMLPNEQKSVNQRIRRQMSMYDPTLANTGYPNGNAAWKKFMSIFMFITPMLTHRPIWEEHFYQGLRELYEDNVIYLEIRSTLPTLYELNGTEYGPVDVARIYKSVTERFVRTHPNFIGARLIYAPIKTDDPAQFDEYVRVAGELKSKIGDFVVGFDLVGQEDTSKPLVDWVDKIRTIVPGLPFFFHAGETNWNGMSVDENLIDAVLLNATRIGHGYAVVKHPELMEMVKRKKIAIEICPISNQVLGLVKDLRNHPASVLFADDYPVVVSNDDPGLWGAKGLSYDFYEAFMGIMSAHADLRALKQLALNSIEYSSLKPAEKTRARQLFDNQWMTFLNNDIFMPNNNYFTTLV